MTADDLIRLIEMRTSPKLRSLQKRIESGTATLRDSFEYSAAVAGIAGRVLSENIIGITPEERELICTALLRQNHREVNDIFAQVQENIDRRNGLTLRPRQGEFPAERVQQFAHSLVDPTVEESVIRRRARSGTENITLSFHDDSVRENAKFRNDAGLTCYLDRQTNGKCCPWCSDAAGRYLYGTEPRDIYRRHDNCNCTVIFENGRQRQNVWTKRSWEAPEVGSGNKPKVFSEDEARRIEQRNLSQIRGISVDNSGGSGIIVGELESIIRFSDNREVPQDVRASIENTMSVIPEHLRSRLERFVSEIIIEEGRGYSSFTPDNNIILDMEDANNSILHELGHAWARMDRLYEDEEFLAVLADGLESENWYHTLSVPHPYVKGEYVYTLESPKFINKYQGRIYTKMIDIDYSEPIPLELFQEYISVGFQTFFDDPELLKEKDEKLYNFLEVKLYGNSKRKS